MITLPPLSAYASVVRAYFAITQGWIETDQVRHALQLERQQVNAAIQYLITQGYLERKYPNTRGRKIQGIQAYRKRERVTNS